MPWPLWVHVLVLTNLTALAFLGTTEGRVVLAAFALAGSLMMVMYRRYGFVRLLGLAHAPWLVTVPWLIERLDDLSGPLAVWVTVVIALNSASLALDGADVARYIAGDREPQV